MNINLRLSELDATINEHNIYFNDTEILHLPMKIMLYELEDYSKLTIELNRKRYACKTFEEKIDCLKYYKKVYLAQKQKYKRILHNLELGSVIIHYPDNLKLNTEYLYEVLDKWKPKHNLSLEKNLHNFMKINLKNNILHINQELYKLNHYPYVYINTFSTFIGPYSVSKYRSDIFTYKDIFITATESNSSSVFHNENTAENTKNALLNMLAFLNGEPYFYFTENYSFNRKLSELYEQFDLLDMLRLRKKDFFDSKYEEPIFLENPLLKHKNNYSNLVCFEDSQHEMIFELYHASLKQFESLPRCVFLYRVFEYGIQKHYQPLLKPSAFSPEDALEYYVNEIMTHNFIPLYYLDSGTYINGDIKNIVKKRKSKYVNFMTKLKAEAKKILKEWQKHPYLKNKGIGKIIYSTGRNAAAHGGSGRTNARYDYSMNYKHINDVNIFLELIARYIIEELNPNLTKMVVRNTKYLKQVNKNTD